jgi:nitroreductase
MIKKLWHRIAGLRIANYRLNALLAAEDDSANSEFILSEIILHYHVLEKGITMPDRRYGFGLENIKELCELIIKYNNTFGCNSNQIIYAVQAIKEYKHIHISNNEVIRRDVNDLIDSVLDLFPNVEESSQPYMTDEEFYRASDKSFYEFSHNRHSCRHFEGSVSEELVIKAITLAQETTPSACNRQSVKVKLITNKDLVANVLKFQSGNRGFGHTFDKLIILTTDMSYWNYVTNIGGYVDGGIYLMNLLYSLYFYKIGACTLNSYFVKEQSIQVRGLLDLPKTEEFVAIIGIGKIKKNVTLAKSGRKEIREILRIY